MERARHRRAVYPDPPALPPAWGLGCQEGLRVQPGPFRLFRRSRVSVQLTPCYRSLVHSLTHAYYPS